MSRASTDEGVVRIKIDVFADFLCPWCYIEKHSLEDAMSRFRTTHPGAEFQVTWRPFYINPLLSNGFEKKTFYENLALAPNRFQGFTTKAHAAARRHNLAFSLRGTVGPSRSAHKLLALTLRRRGRSAQAAVVEALYYGHFTDGQDISDRAWLADVGAAVGGLERDEVERELVSREAERLVDGEARRAREEEGVTAVPCVTVQGRYRVGGYQEEEVFEGLFERVWAESMD